MNTLFYSRFSKTRFACFSIILLLSVSTQIKAQLTVSPVKDTVSTCLKANFKIRITTNAPAGATFAWSGPNGYVSNEQDASINNLTTNGKGVYTVTVNSGGQSATATSCVKLNSISVAQIGGFTDICVGQNLQLRDIEIRPVNEKPLAYFWTGPDNYTSNAASTNIPTTEDLRQLGEYSLTETFDNGCMVTASLTPTITKCLSIGNLVWQDMNNDGINNNGESGLGNVTVRLFKAKIESGTPTNIPDGVAIQTTTTDAITGKYLFTNLVPNFYIVEIDTPLGYSSSVGINGSPTGVYEPSNKANEDINDDDDGTMIAGQKIRTNYIMLSNFGEPQNDGDATNGTESDRNSNLTIDFGVYRIPVPICSTDPKCSPILVRKTN
jgi:SdrD B-like domain